VSVSSLSAAVVDQFTGPRLAVGEVPVDLLGVLAAVPDPRSRRGVRHRFVAVLGIAVCAVLAGARSYVTISEWAKDLPTEVRFRLGLGRVPPCESTIRRVLQAVDPDALDGAVSSWLAARAGPGVGRRVIAVDGKSARGARGTDGRPVHLLAAFGTRPGTVLGQTVVNGKTNELLGRLRGARVGGK